MLSWLSSTGKRFFVVRLYLYLRVVVGLLKLSLGSLSIVLDVTEWIDL